LAQLTVVSDLVEAMHGKAMVFQAMLMMDMNVEGRLVESTLAVHLNTLAPTGLGVMDMEEKDMLRSNKSLFSHRLSM
jgi:hypothetical protein